ncbi:hypothetical protein DXB44_05725 [Faecalibacterium sp. OM04-11BH]|nr:hypothetical protein DXB44_05725 [Faecalibacterium sp. OM04-11BH]
MNALRVALRINSGKNIFYFGIAERLRTLRYPIFTGRGRDGERQLPRWFPAETAARRGKYPFRHRLRRCHLPQGDGFIGRLISMVKVDSLLKKSLLSDTLNITNLIRRNEADHGCKNACPVENTV